MAYKYKYNPVTGKQEIIQKDKRSYPLRKVIERSVNVKWNDITNQYEECNDWTGKFGNRLECGHVVMAAKDFYGEIHSEKQRCKYCHLNKVSE